MAKSNDMTFSSLAEHVIVHHECHCKLSKHFQITAPNEVMTNINANNVVDILGIIESEDRDVIILTMKEEEPRRVSNETDIIYDLNFLNEQNDIQSPKQNNILRWLPKKKHIQSPNREKRKVQAAKEADNIKIRAENAARVAYITSNIEHNRIAADFLYNEVKRIQKDHELVDDIREMILRLEGPGQEKFKEEVLKCIRKAKDEADVGITGILWKNPPNTWVINTVKDSQNHGVL